MLRFAFVASVLLVGCKASLAVDPFGAPPLGASPNCGPEHRSRLEAIVTSKDVFAHLLDTTPIAQVALDDFKDADGRLATGKVIAATRVEQLGGRTLYILDYHPEGCSTAQKHTLKITNDGHVSVYGCCGK